MTAKLTEVDSHAFVAHYQDGATLAATAEAFDVSRFVARRVLREAGVRPRGTRARDLDAAIAAYQAGMTLDRAAAAGRVTGRTLTDALAERDICRRAPGEARRVRLTVECLADAIQQYRDGSGHRVIARALGASPTTVRLSLLDAGVTPNERGSNHRGPGEFGRFTSPHGYVLVGLLREHPRHDMTNSAGYVLEHRLVIALALGRALSSKETVHHVNGVKHDNAIENLQLRSGHHGQGVVLVCHACGSHNVGPAELPEEVAS